MSAGPALKHLVGKWKVKPYYASELALPVASWLAFPERAAALGLRPDVLTAWTCAPYGHVDAIAEVAAGEAAAGVLGGCSFGDEGQALSRPGPLGVSAVPCPSPPKRHTTSRKRTLFTAEGA
jgi:hypothetical protein